MYLVFIVKNSLNFKNGLLFPLILYPMELFDIRTPQKDRFEWAELPYERDGRLWLPDSNAVSLHSGWGDMHFHYYPREKYVLYINVYRTKERRRTVAQANGDTVEFTFMLGGSMVNRLGGFEEIAVKPMQYNLSYLPGFESESLMEANQFYATLDIRFEKTYLWELMVAFPETIEPLMEWMEKGVRGRLYRQPYFADHFIRNIVQQIMAGLRNGDMEGIVLDKHVHTLLMHMLATETGIGRKVLEQGRRQLMNEIYGRLISELMELPAMKELQRQYGLGATMMRAMFKTTFGETMRDVWVKHRLDKALGMVAYEREKRIKEIGTELGFLSVSNFSKAFINAYGFSPRAMRNGAEIVNGFNYAEF